MSPEQARGGARDVTVASDVWALGVMLHQMLSGRVPFDAENHQEIFRRILEEEPSSLTGKVISHQSSVISGPVRVTTDHWSLNTDYSSRDAADLSTIVLRCLEMGSAPSVTRRRAGGHRGFLARRQRHQPRALAARRGQRCRGPPRAHAAETDTYFARVANELAERERFDFGAAPKCLALDRATDCLIVPTEDRRLFRVDPATGGAVQLGRVPESSSAEPAGEVLHGFRELGFAHDGRHYFVVEGNQVPWWTWLPAGSSSPGRCPGERRAG